jgi:hypothetical protein
VAAVTLDQVRAGAAEQLYPRHLLVGCETGLVLFAAAFHGQQDAVWFAEAELLTTCVDLDSEKLAEMQRMYPAEWEFGAVDVFEFASSTERKWDIVSLDPPSNLFDRCAELLPLWCLLANRAVILGTGKNNAVNPPPGWGVSDRVRRSGFFGGVYWTVVEPC